MPFTQRERSYVQCLTDGVSCQTASKYTYLHLQQRMCHTDVVNRQIAYIYIYLFIYIYIYFNLLYMFKFGTLTGKFPLLNHT